MSEASMLASADPLILTTQWRLPEQGQKPEGATVHPLRVISGAGRGKVDHDELRTLVTEILRDELRSEFGHRVTRSIRRLVRDEVARIFARIGGR